MHDELERVTRLLDDVAAGRDPRAHMELSAVERHLAETAVLLTSARAAGWRHGAAEKAKFRHAVSSVDACLSAIMLAEHMRSQGRLHVHPMQANAPSVTIERYRAERSPL